jgi:hypothetical protein
MSLKGAAYIAGAFEHPTRKAPDKSVALLHAECAKGALDDAGLTKDDVDGYFCAGDAPGMGPLSMVDYLNLNVRHIDATDIGGSSYLMLVAHAAEAIAAGRCNVALITLAGRPRSEGQATGTAPRAGNPAQPDMQFEYVCDVCAASHARIRHHQRTARLDQGRRFAPCAIQRARHVARRGDGAGRGELADNCQSAAPPGLLRHQRRRRCAGGGEAGDRPQPEAS